MQHTVHQVVAENAGVLHISLGKNLPVRSPRITKVVVVIVKAAKGVSNSIVEVRSGPVDRVAITFRRDTVGVDRERAPLLRNRHHVVGNNPALLNEPLLKRKKEKA